MVFYICLLLVHTAAAQEYNWNGKRLNFTLKPDGSFQVTDKKAEKTWRWDRGDGIEGKSISKNKNGCTLRATRGNFSFEAEFEVGPDEDFILIRLSGDPKTKMDGLNYPGPMVSSMDSLVLPINEGLLIPPDDRMLEELKLSLSGNYPIYQGHNGVSMPWVGLTDFKSGLMILVDDSVDAEFEIKHTPGFSVGVKWLPIRQTLGETRKLRLVFPKEGGYVPMAKAYRSYLEERSEWVGLDEKVRRDARVRKLSGALNIWLWRTTGLDEAFEYVRDTVKLKECIVSFPFHAETSASTEEGGRLRCTVL